MTPYEDDEYLSPAQLIAAARELHMGESRDDMIGNWCRLEHVRWPCLTVLLADALREAQAGTRKATLAFREEGMTPEQLIAEARAAHCSLQGEEDGGANEDQP